MGSKMELQGDMDMIIRDDRSIHYSLGNNTKILVSGTDSSGEAAES